MSQMEKISQAERIKKIEELKRAEEIIDADYLKNKNNVQRALQDLFKYCTHQKEDGTSAIVNNHTGTICPICNRSDL